MNVPTHVCLGNCWWKALTLARASGGTVRHFRSRTARCGSRHYYCRLPSGESWHFKVQKDLLPWPLSGLIFLGRYESLSNREKKDAPVQGGQRCP